MATTARASACTSADDGPRKVFGDFLFEILQGSACDFPKCQFFWVGQLGIISIPSDHLTVVSGAINSLYVKIPHLTAAAANLQLGLRRFENLIFNTLDLLVPSVGLPIYLRA